MSIINNDEPVRESTSVDEYKQFTINILEEIYKFNSEENENVSLKIYEQLDKLDSSIFEEIKNDIGCTSIIFKLNEKNLFEL